MKKVVVTGAQGFIGKNLSERLRQLEAIEVIEYNKDSNVSLETILNKADFVFHLAGVNRPQDEKEFEIGNRDLTKQILSLLKGNERAIPLLLSSSTQAEQDNPYGRSKLAAEQLVRNYHQDTGAPVFIYRLPNVFGKWCRPNYNSAIATFCHNITHNLPITVNNASTELRLAYIDEVIDDFLACLNGSIQSEEKLYEPTQSYSATLGEIVETLTSLHAIRTSLIIPDLSYKLTKHLYSTMISYYDEDDYSYELTNNVDERGWLSELIKSQQFGQVFISKTKPGFTRGNHWHHSKIEKFAIIDGEGELSFRKVGSKKVFKYKVDGNKLQVIDIPVGYVHSITNTGPTDMTMVIWANEILDKSNPDTYYEEV